MPLIKYNGKTYAGSDVDLKDKVVTFESGDGLEPTGPADVPLMESGGRVKNLMRSISLAVRNTRYLLKVLGTTDISAIGDGTLTGAINELNTGMIKEISLTGDVTGTNTLDAGCTVIQVKRRGCISVAALNGWYRVATLTKGLSWEENGITFLVTDTFGPDTGEAGGILHAHIRINNGNPVCSLTWLTAGPRINPADFVIASRKVEYKVDIGIWNRNAENNHRLLFEVLGETADNGKKGAQFELHDCDVDSMMDAIPSGYAQVQSKLATVQNPVKNVASIFVASYSGGSYSFSFKFAVDDPNSDHRVPVLVIIGSQIDGHTTMVPLTLLGLIGGVSRPPSLPEGISSVTAEGHIVTITCSHNMRYANFMVLYDGFRSSIEKVQ